MAAGLKTAGSSPPEPGDGSAFSLLLIVEPGPDLVDLESQQRDVFVFVDLALHILRMVTEEKVPAAY